MAGKKKATPASGSSSSRRLPPAAKEVSTDVQAYNHLKELNSRLLTGTAELRRQVELLTAMVSSGGVDSGSCSVGGIRRDGVALSSPVASTATSPTDAPATSKKQRRWRRMKNGRGILKLVTNPPLGEAGPDADAVAEETTAGSSLKMAAGPSSELDHATTEEIDHASPVKMAAEPSSELDQAAAEETTTSPVKMAAEPSSELYQAAAEETTTSPVKMAAEPSSELDQAEETTTSLVKMAAETSSELDQAAAEEINHACTVKMAAEPSSELDHAASEEIDHASPVKMAAAALHQEDDEQVDYDLHAIASDTLCTINGVESDHGYADQKTADADHKAAKFGIQEEAELLLCLEEAELDHGEEIQAAAGEKRRSNGDIFPTGCIPPAFSWLSESSSPSLQ